MRVMRVMPWRPVLPQAPDNSARQKGLRMTLTPDTGAMLTEAAASEFGIAVLASSLAAALYLRRRLYAERDRLRKAGTAGVDDLSVLIRRIDLTPQREVWIIPPASPREALFPLSLPPPSPRRTPRQNPSARPPPLFITLQFFAFRHNRHLRPLRHPTQPTPATSHAARARSERTATILSVMVPVTLAPLLG